MFTHNLDPILFDFGFFAIRWYSLAYIFGIFIGWWYGKILIERRFSYSGQAFELREFDEIISYLIISIIIGGRIGYVVFYNLNYFLLNPLDIFKIWEGGMSFHGALIGIVIGTYFFSIKKNINTFFLLDIIACVAPIGIFLGRIANFINGELVGKVTKMPWGVIFPSIDMLPRHPSQIYEAILEGLVLFFIININIKKRNYIIGYCSTLFLIYYGIFRIFSEIFRQPDPQLGYFFQFFTMGSILSLLMVLTGIFLINYLKKKDEN